MLIKDFSYFNSKGQPVRGAAAFTHEVFTVCGGLNGFLKKCRTQTIIIPAMEQINKLGRFVSMLKR